jgi:hypothetical protein
LLDALEAGERPPVAAPESDGVTVAGD